MCSVSTSRSRVTYSGTKLSRKFTEIKDKTVKNINMTLFIMLNVQKVSAQNTTPEKLHESCQKEYLTVMIEMLKP